MAQPDTDMDELDPDAIRADHPVFRIIDRTEGEPRPPYRLGENHIAVRFGDEYFQVWLNGEDVSDWVDEAHAAPAPHGWVYMLNDANMHFRRVYGDVRVEKRDEAWARARIRAAGGIA